MGMTTGGGFGFRLDAARVEPSDDPRWAIAPRPLRARFWAEAGRFAARRWDASRAKGLDRDGRPLTPIGAATMRARRDDINPVTGRNPYSPMGRARASAPPLTPAGAASRTRSLLRWRTEPGKGVWFTWIYDRNTRHYWGAILARHARGFVQRFQAGFRFVPPRDVLGFSEAEIISVREHMSRWWRANAPRPMRMPDAPPARIAARAGRPEMVGEWRRVPDAGVWTRGAGVSLDAPPGSQVILDSGWGDFRVRAVRPPTPPRPPRVPPAAAMPVPAITPRRVPAPRVVPPLPVTARQGPPRTVLAAIRSRGVTPDGDTLRLLADRMAAIRAAGFTLREVQGLARAEPDRRLATLWRLAWELTRRGIDPGRLAG